ncbi:Protein O-mannosyl-transferase tmtc3 [Dermatophagoides farinae]|uniref:dolichyl-phosphate-mannose--protein mannosyltransferase n=1 Tax=Dermatophagoides farinae TaxID=6954 RepID=A0A922KVQ1_DERFA|nr:Protein O-mannosyl-transferase tmtc3 [Dermatophagoides farinae]
MAAFRFYTDSSNGYDDHQHNRRQKQRLPICLNQIFHLKKKKDKNVSDLSFSSNSTYSFWTYLNHHNHKSDIVIVIICLCCYYNALYCDFVFDDISAIKENPDIRTVTPIINLFYNDFWGLPMDNSYRPLCVLTFRFNYWLHQLRPYGYHLINIILHIIVSLQYFRFCQLFMSTKSSFLAAILFSVHPIHTEAVTSLVGRAECLCAIFFLATIFSYHRLLMAIDSNNKWIWLMASITSITVSTFSKEQGITSIAICMVIEIFFNQKLQRLASKLSLKVYYNNNNNDYKQTKSLKRISSLSVLSCPKWIKEMITRITIIIVWTILLLTIRFWLMRWQLPIFTKFDNPAVNAPNRLSRQLTQHYLYAFNIWLLLNPWTLCCDWTMGSIQLIESFNDHRNIVTLIFYSFFFLLIYKSFGVNDGCRIIMVSLSLMIFPFIPASNIFFPVGFVVAERVLYIPSFGYCMLIAHGFGMLSYHFDQSNKKFIEKYVIHFVFIILIIVHSSRTIMRNEDWKNEHNIFASGIRVNSNNAKLLNNLGHVYEIEKQYYKALDLFLEAVHRQPDDIGAYSNVARVYNHIGRIDLSEQYYSKAKTILMSELRQTSINDQQQRFARIAPVHLNIFLNLANLISRNQSRLQEADDLYRQVIRMRPDYVEAYINRGDILLRMNRTNEANNIYPIHSNRFDMAIDYFQKAIEINSKHLQALFNFAIVVQDAKRFELFDQAWKRLKMLTKYDENNERIYFNMAMISMANKNYTDAEQLFRQTLQLKPNFSSANFNLALLLTENHRPIDALPYLQRLLKQQPEHFKGLTLLCDILINNVKDFDQASHCYKQILKLDPKNIQAKHNLCVVFIEKDQLDLAEDCLNEARQIAPNQDYIDRHLKIVRLRIIKKRNINHNN